MSEPSAEKDVTWFPSLSAAKSAVCVGSEIEVREVYINGEGGSSLHATRYYVRTQDLQARVLPPEGIDQAKADAWDEGYYRGTLDTTSDLEPADNPYRPLPPAADQGGHR